LYLVVLPDVLFLAERSTPVVARKVSKGRKNLEIAARQLPTVIFPDVLYVVVLLGVLLVVDQREETIGRLNDVFLFLHAFG